MTDVPQITQVTGPGVPIRGSDIDTDRILPARFLKETSFEQLDQYLFYDARRDGDGSLNEHPLNTYSNATIAVVNDNFGSGSSREHAPQAMQRWGIDGLVGESFAEIFKDNCKSLGMPTATADSNDIRALQDWIDANPTSTIRIDVATETVQYDDQTIHAEIDQAMREALLQGIWDTTRLMAGQQQSVETVMTALPYTDQ